MWQDILTAFSLYLIIEGMIPFVGPEFFRQAVSRISELSDSSLRMTGFTVMTVGVLMLFIVRH